MLLFFMQAFCLNTARLTVKTKTQKTIKKKAQRLPRVSSLSPHLQTQSYSKVFENMFVVYSPPFPSPLFDFYNDLISIEFFLSKN